MKTFKYFILNFIGFFSSYLSFTLIRLHFSPQSSCPKAPIKSIDSRFELMLPIFHGILKKNVTLHNYKESSSIEQSCWKEESVKYEEGVNKAFQ